MCQHPRSPAIWYSVVGLAGCAPHRPRAYPVIGHAHFANGEAVQLGTVEFRESKNGTIARGKIATDGTFRLTTFKAGDGAIKGTHKVIVQQLIITEDRSYQEHNHGRRVPRKYADYSTTSLEVVIKPETENTVDLTLTPAN